MVLSDIMIKVFERFQFIGKDTGFCPLIQQYLTARQSEISYQYSQTIKKHLRSFAKYLSSIGIRELEEVSSTVLMQYKGKLINDHLAYTKDSLVVRSQIERLRIIVRFIRHCFLKGLFEKNPTEQIDWSRHYYEIKRQERLCVRKLCKPLSPSALECLKDSFLKYQTSIGKSYSSILRYNKGIEVFLGYLEIKEIVSIEEITQQHILNYYLYLMNIIGARGRPIGNSYKNQLIWSVKLFFKFLVRFDYVKHDLTYNWETIREDRGLPHTCMDEMEVFHLLKMPELRISKMQLRDKAILETLFSCGMRSNELCSLDINDIDLSQEMVRINNPKGGIRYQRIVPIGKKALKAVELYLRDQRPLLVKNESLAVFLSCSGERIKTEAVLDIVKKYAILGGLTKNITTHSMRVTCATLMLKNGANMRYVQEQLGHRNISTTQIYTRLVPSDLKTAHQKYHPRELVICQ